MLAAVLTLMTAVFTTVLAAPATKHVIIKNPKASAVYYAGDRVKLAATLKKYEVGEAYGEASQYTITMTKKSAKKPVFKKVLGDNRPGNGDEGTNDPWMFPDSNSYSYKKTLKTSKYPAGNYIFRIDFMGTLTEESAEQAIELDRYDLLGASESASVPLTFKKLKAPAKLKVKTGKKKVTVTYKKAAGAKKYEIYRSKKKSKGYKKRATTKKAKFVDKKVKKGKKYYYKVRSVRTKYGTVRSKFTKPKRSKKVKK
jgi:hypothetical protein